MTPSLVSVIIPCFRQAHFLAGAIDSALRQTYPSVEVVVVNDGSDDRTEEVARGYGDRIKYVSQVNQGLPAARNSGIATATGQYLLCLDSDDLLHPDAVKWLVDAAAGREDVVCVMGYRSFADEAALSSAPDVLPPQAGAGGSLLSWNLGPPHTYLTPRAKVVACGGFDRGLRACEDWELWVRLVFAGCEVVSVRRAGAYYRQHTSSMSKNGRLMAEHYVRVLRRISRWTRERPGAVTSLGLDPRQVDSEARSKIGGELFDAGYYSQNKGEYGAALSFYLSSLYHGRLKAVGGICKLVPHRLLRGARR